MGQPVQLLSVCALGQAPHGLRYVPIVERRQRRYARVRHRAPVGVPLGQHRFVLLPRTLQHLPLNDKPFSFVVVQRLQQRRHRLPHLIGHKAPRLGAVQLFQYAPLLPDDLRPGLALLRQLLTVDGPTRYFSPCNRFGFLHQRVCLVHLPEAFKQFSRYRLGHLIQIHPIWVADFLLYRLQCRHYLLHFSSFVRVPIKHFRPFCMHVLPRRVKTPRAMVFSSGYAPSSLHRVSEFLERAIQLFRLSPLRFRQLEPSPAQVVAHVRISVVHVPVDMLAIFQHVPRYGRHGFHGTLALRIRPGIGHGVVNSPEVFSQIVYAHLAFIFFLDFPRKFPYLPAVNRLRPR